MGVVGAAVWILAGVGLVAAGGAAVATVWNWLLPAVSGGRVGEISFWQAAGGSLVVLVVVYVAESLWWRGHCAGAYPWYLAYLLFVLEAPIMKWLAGSSTVIERLNLGPGMHVIDVGCGPGRITIPLAKHVGPGGRVVALDAQEKMLVMTRRRAARNRLGNVDTVLARAGTGALQEENAFDRAVLVTALGEIAGKKAALAEILKALKPGGMLSITEVFLDPDYQDQSTIRRLASDTGFEFDAKFGSALAFTLNFRKPSIQ